MKKKLVLAFAVIGLAVASAKTYNLTLYSPASVGDTKLAAGAYTVELKDSKAVIKNGTVHGEFPVKVEPGEKKYDSTTVRFNNSDGKMQIEEIRLGGTTTKLVFNN